MSRFEIGDIVECVLPNNELNKGSMYRVIGEYSPYDDCCSFLIYLSNLSGNTILQQGYTPERFKLVPENSIEPPDCKETNPKDAVGIKKPPFSTVPAQVTNEVGVAMLEGAMKYGRHNYRQTGVRASVYYDAAMRHLTSYWEGEDIDPDSGLSHIAKAIASLYVMRDAQINKKFTDDRPPKIDTTFKLDLQLAVDGLFNKYPTPKEAITQTMIEGD